MPHGVRPGIGYPDSMEWLSSIQQSLGAIGLNAVGVADGQDYGHVLPGCRAVVVFASGGTALWDAFMSDLQTNPRQLTEHTHPLDDFVHRAIHAADPEPPSSRRWVRCAAEPELFVDFRPLAENAGLGWRSRTGLLLHPRYGLWMGMRAACFTTEALPLDSALQEESPCTRCPGHCASACPGEAFAGGSISIRRCAAFNVASDVCHGRCAARLSCPEGQGHRHGTLQHHYHYARDTGRPALAAHLQIVDHGTGVGPNWASWAEDS